MQGIALFSWAGREGSGVAAHSGGGPLRPGKAHSQATAPPRQHCRVAHQGWALGSRSQAGRQWDAPTLGGGRAVPGEG